MEEENDEWQDQRKSADKEEQNRVEVNPVFSEAIGCRGLVTKVVFCSCCFFSAPDTSFPAPDSSFQLLISPSSS